MNRNDQSLTELLRIFSANPKMKAKLFEKRIENSWPKIVGPWIAGETESLALKGSTLVIRVKSASLRQELHYSKDKILEQVNAELGEEFLLHVDVR